MTVIDKPAVHILRRAMVARIATMSRTGRPHVNPLYFVVIDGRIHLGTATYTLAAHNVEANPAVEIIFEDERNRRDQRLLRLQGTASVRTDPPLMERYRRGVARKYVVTPRGLLNMLVHPRQWGPMRRHMAGGQACVIEVTPSSVEVVARRARQPTGAAVS